MFLSQKLDHQQLAKHLSAQAITLNKRPEIHTNISAEIKTLTESIARATQYNEREQTSSKGSAGEIGS